MCMPRVLHTYTNLGCMFKVVCPRVPRVAPAPLLCHLANAFAVTTWSLHEEAFAIKLWLPIFFGASQCD